MWWPNRVESEVTQEEMKIAEYKETEGGVMLWCSFNASLNSSTRCELAAAIIAMIAPRPVHIGIDNQTVVGKGTEIIQHERRRQEEDRYGKNGAMMFGGKRSRLHKKTPYKRGWAHTRDGDLWDIFADLVRDRGPETVKISKVKGHATEEMVSEGKVKAEDKEGNDKADEAADQGATKSQGKVQKFAELYAWRQGMYRKIWQKIKTSSLKSKRRKGD